MYYTLISWFLCSKLLKMRSPTALSVFIPHYVFIIQLVAAAAAQVERPKAAAGGPFPAIFAFGDSTVDPGNNNYIDTLHKGNFPPYGIGFLNHIPTGRFTNGRLVTDFIASYVGIKEYVPAYLDPRLSMEDLMTGVSFASSASGFDPLTPVVSRVIPIMKQLDYFREYIKRIETAIGKEGRENLIKNAIYIVSSGTNDYMLNYYSLPISSRCKTYNISSYQQLLVPLIQQFLQDLLELGAQKIMMGGILPLGCLPIEITLNSFPTSNKRNCIDSLSSVAVNHNQLLQQILVDIQKPEHVRLLYFDSFYRPLTNILLNPTSSGFDDTNITGCCGTGLLEASYFCNPISPICSNISTYVFFDSVHPTERAYYIIFEDMCSTVDLLIKG